MKFFKLAMGIVIFSLSFSSHATVCTVEGTIDSIVPSMGVAGVGMGKAIPSCSCDYNTMWIDTTTDGGKAIYSAALSAKIAGNQISVTIEDGRGQGFPGNTSVTYRYWSTCQILALEIR